MTFIDTNLTFSKQVCDYAVGGVIGGLSVMGFVIKVLTILLGFYVIYRLTKVLIARYYYRSINVRKRKR